MSIETKPDERSEAREMARYFTDILVIGLGSDAPRMPFKFSEVRQVIDSLGLSYLVAVASFSSRNYMFSFESTLQQTPDRPVRAIYIEGAIPDQETGEHLYSPYFRLQEMLNGEIVVDGSDAPGQVARFNSAEATSGEEVQVGLCQPPIKRFLTSYRKGQAFYDEV